MQGQAVAQRGRVRAFGIVRDKNGVPVVDDFDSLPVEIKNIIEMEVKRGDYTLDGCKNSNR